MFSAWSLLRAFGRSRTWVIDAISSYLRRTAPRYHWLLPPLAQRLGQLGKRLVEIGDEAIVGDLEDRRLLVLVDRHDHLGILHAGEMLDRTRNADRDVKLRRHHLAGLPDLPVVRRVAGIDRGARGTDRRAELVGDRLDVLGEVLSGLHRAPARDDDLGRGEFRAFRLRQFLADETGNARIGRGARVL